MRQRTDPGSRAPIGSIGGGRQRPLPGGPVARKPAMTPLVIGVTSHRDIPDDEVEPLRKQVAAFFTQPREAFPELPLVVLSALAEGGDQLIAEEALAAGARLIAPLPL